MKYFLLPLVLSLLMIVGCAGDNTPSRRTTASGSQVNGQGGISVWANDGGDKVTQDELRMTKNSAAGVRNKIWNGNQISLSAAKNEVVAFNLVIEAGGDALSGVQVSFDKLEGENGAKIESKSTNAAGVFNWTNRNIELFFVRYLQIKGLSAISYEVYDERHIPSRLRRPWTGNGIGKGSWKERPDHDKYYPDIAVPMELVSKMNIAKGQNQSVWADIYVPTATPAGTYHGTVTVAAAGGARISIPVQLEVHSFALDDVPNAKTMVNLGYSDIATRYVGEQYPNPGTASDTKLKQIRDRHFQMAHRHKISLIDANQGSSADPGDRPRSEWLPRLSGELFTAEHGYAGPGVEKPNDVFSIGTYGSWNWKNGGEPAMRLHSDGWVNWFKSNFPKTEYFLYLIDESEKLAETQTMAEWITKNPGPGKALPSFATVPLTAALKSIPSLSIAATWFAVGDTATWQKAYDDAKAAGKKVFMYNGKRPSNGSFATEDDGVALRELAWAQYKKGIDRWFFWESTYYNNGQGGQGETDVFKFAQTFGAKPTKDDVFGEKSWNHSNGDGLLFYPGTDKVFPANSYDIAGPIASLRLKMWRRGIQDVDYIAAANRVNRELTKLVVDRMVPKALWEYGIDSAKDPTYVSTDISWSTLSDDWEAAREDLTNIIEGKAKKPDDLHSSIATPAPTKHSPVFFCANF